MSTLKKRIEELEKENLTLLREIQENDKKYDHLKKNLELFFTNGQMKRLMDSKCGRAHWFPKDIASAISLRSVSPKAYRYLKRTLRSVSPKAYRYLKRTGYPLPALSTLRRWASNFSFDTGVLYDVMKLLKTKANSLSKLEKLCVLSFDTKANSLSKLEKLCVLSFDEIYVSNRVDIEKREQQRIGPHQACQTVMARGLIGHWKQTKANSLSKLEKLCVLSFDEIYVSNRVDIEKREQQRIGPHQACQTLAIWAQKI
ncbi:Transposase protein [Popillia japonica]|uniref:Transposase protein n=1 Tax=Popillia japonica TaxID=7064 RepID=A0AAW1KNX9_POPJA